MFTLPPLPPKDYVLRDVRQTQLSAPDHNPFSAPRVTQTSLGKFCSPLQYQEEDKLGDVQIEAVNTKVLDNWADKARAWWVIKPGQDDYFLHDIFKKYTVQVDPTGYDPRYKHKERPFYRSYHYELECIENFRLEKLRSKNDRERLDDDKKWKECLAPKKPTEIEVAPCKIQSPFWWRKGHDKSRKSPLRLDDLRLESEYGVNYRKRWQDEPNFLQSTKTEIDPCGSREGLAQVGLPFRSEACNWYYSNYPPPELRHIQKRFA